jgi:hypothetical protein
MAKKKPASNDSSIERIACSEKARLPIESLVQDPRNARLHSAENLAAIRLSIESFGQVSPLVVQKSTKLVIGGNGTMQVLKDLGWSECDVVLIDCTDAEAVRLALALNRTAELASWDNEVLKTIFAEVLQAGAEPVGWTKAELEKVCGIKPVVQDEVPALPVVPITQPGDVYILGRTAVCPNCQKKTNV